MKRTLQCFSTGLMVTLVALVAFPTAQANADVTVGVDPSQNWIGFMNVFERDETTGAPGAFVFGSEWGFNDLTAEFVGDQLVLGPNTIGDPDPFWYIGGGAPGAQGNKWMDANGFVQVDDAFAGMNVTFSGEVLSNTFTSDHTASVFIRDFAPDFSSVNEIIVPLTTGAFEITLATDPGAGRHVQYGFNVQGENVWITDVGGFGTVNIQAVPEPATASLLAFGTVALFARRRRS